MRSNFPWPNFSVIYYLLTRTIFCLLRKFELAEFYCNDWIDYVETRVEILLICWIKSLCNFVYYTLENCHVGFAPKRCTPFKTHEMESFKSLRRTCQLPPRIAPSLVKTAFTSYFPLPPMSLIGHNLGLGLQRGSLDLVSASRNTVLHSCRFWLNEPVSPNLLLHVYWDGVINWLLLNHLKLRKGKHRLVAWQWRSTDHS